MASRPTSPDQGPSSPTAAPANDRICGHVFRWTWTEESTASATHEHVFNRDGSVIWTCLTGSGKDCDPCQGTIEAVR